MNLKKKIPIFSALLILVILLLDYFIFSFLFLKFPNELEWDTSPWYNFLHYKKNIEFDSTKKKILIAGSSVALYSFIPISNKLGTDSLDEKNQSIDTNFYSHVAMSPTDLYYYADEMISKKPDTIYYLLNSGDFQMDYFIEKENGKFEYSEQDRISSYVYRHPVKINYPFAFLKDNFFELNKKEIYSLLTKSFLFVNRYRTFFFDPIEAFIEHHFKSNRSYHNYLGPNAYENEIYRKGWTDSSFAIPCDVSKNFIFEESILISKPNTEIKIKSYLGETIYNETFPKTGWNKLKFNVPTDFTPMIFFFEIKPSTSSFEVDNKLYGKEYEYGIRLTQYFCKKEIERNISYSRRNSRDDLEIENMSKEDYENDYFLRMYQDADKFIDDKKTIPKRPEVQRLYKLHKVKKFLAKNSPKNWSEFLMLEKLSKKISDSNIKFVIINNPENPLELAFYQNGDWYKNYLLFLKSLEKEKNVKFYDYKNVISKKQYFLDSHHLTYNGALEYSNFLYNELLFKD